MLLLVEVKRSKYYILDTDDMLIEAFSMQDLYVALESGIEVRNINKHNLSIIQRGLADIYVNDSHKVENDRVPINIDTSVYFYEESFNYCSLMYGVKYKTNKKSYIFTGSKVYEVYVGVDLWIDSVNRGTDTIITYLGYVTSMKKFILGTQYSCYTFDDTGCYRTKSILGGGKKTFISSGHNCTSKQFKRLVLM